MELDVLNVKINKFYTKGGFKRFAAAITLGVAISIVMAYIVYVLHKAWPYCLFVLTVSYACLYGEYSKFCKSEESSPIVVSKQKSPSGSFISFLLLWFFIGGFITFIPWEGHGAESYKYPLFLLIFLWLILPVTASQRFFKKTNNSELIFKLNYWAWGLNIVGIYGYSALFSGR